MKIRKLGAIDIGSNAMRLLINYVYEEEGRAPIFNKTSIVRMPIRLGHDVFIDGQICENNVERICDAMLSYALMMKVYDVEIYKAYATSAMREAKNGNEVVKKVMKKSGINIEIIDGKTEAELLFNTELGAFIKDKKIYLYVDVGGGSTELTLLKDNKVFTSKSFEVGTVRLLENKVAPTTFEEMKEWIQENIGHDEIELIGSGGNINHVYKYSGVKLGMPLSSTYVKKHYQTLQSMTAEERMQNFNMKPDRADVVVYALEIYNNVLKWSHAKKIHVPKVGLSDGVIREIYKNL
ncbi:MULTISPECIES: Ppx/GppA phosphatase family protein [Empedobacter]|uniref:Ppx/GppA phosphatase family protein n=1 Tax=Empedobacter TaxID=59734 RepID=UPI001CE055EF|nr:MULTISPECIES: exopolyphosphatase [Empedobacter]MCA4777525.1 exopolyphosphatase [Empedobacter stercoris]MDM1523332.1 exopolyphosphatase [Empedobacter sp. 225-1]MDM1543231.1 exopolyphosphatase [Empedobacter sp. 189-2]HJD87015.1 exopolyphosphatase [Empedobacter falsenii]